MIATADHVSRMLDPFGPLVLVLLVSAAIALLAWTVAEYRSR
jgi:hypothetical protein